MNHAADLTPAESAAARVDAPAFDLAAGPDASGESKESTMPDLSRLPRRVRSVPDASPAPATMDSRWTARPAGITVALLATLWAGAAEAASGGGDHNPVMEAVWQAVNLVIILGVLVYFGRAPIQAYFASRHATIKNELTEAADLLTQAEHRNSELQRRLVDLNSELEGIRESANARAEDEAEKILADARASAERIRNDAKAAAAQELSRAQLELRKEAANIAMDLAAQKLSQNVADPDRDRLMDEFITRIEPSSDSRPGEGAN